MIDKDQNKIWELISAKLHNEANNNELEQLDELLEDKKNDAVFGQVERLKTNLKEVKKLRAFSQERSWNSIAKQIKGKKISMVWQYAKYAAIITVAFLLGSVFNMMLNTHPEITGYAEVKVPLGQMSELTLFDGTKVWLNSGTTFRYNNEFGKSVRDVSIDGEAFFDVTKSKIPFKVAFRGKEVEVLGTQFNVMAYDDEKLSQVTLVEGKVKVNNEKETVATLKPSEQLSINERNQTSKIKQVETNFFVSWTAGKIVFDEDNLAEVSRKLERWYNVDIRFEDKEVKNLRFSGTILKNKPFDQIIAAFEILLPVDVEYTHILGAQDKVVIAKKK